MQLLLFFEELIMHAQTYIIGEDRDSQEGKLV